jgi:seryl-tRNA synthetase
MPRSVLERTGYFRSFPDLVGSLNTFAGDDREHARLLALADAGTQWADELTPTETVMCPATCLALYPTMTGRLPAGGHTAECHGDVFRHEPSQDPTRMLAFHQLEFVYFGDPEAALAQRDGWLRRAADVVRDLGLDVEPMVANDPFFGRTGRFLASSQRETELKYELVTSVTAQRRTALGSANYHRDHFGSRFGIETAAGEVAHSTCIGFGLERVTLALMGRYGLDPVDWPEAVRTRLWP